MFTSNETAFSFLTGDENATQDTNESLGTAHISGIVVGVVAFFATLTAVLVLIKKILILAHRIMDQFSTFLDETTTTLRKWTGNELPPPPPPRVGHSHNRADDSLIEIERQQRTDNPDNADNTYDTVNGYGNYWYDTANNPTDDTLISHQPYTLSRATYL